MPINDVDTQHERWGGRVAGIGVCRAPIEPLSQRFPGLNVADANAIQQVNLSRRLGQGRTVVGHKIGLTSEPMQTLLGVDEPDFGYILDDMVLGNGAAVSAARFCLPRVEPEVKPPTPGMEISPNRFCTLMSAITGVVPETSWQIGQADDDVLGLGSRVNGADYL